MAEAPHGTAPSLEGKNVANPMAMLLACAAVLEHAGIQGDERAEEASRTLRRATLATGWTAFVACLGGSASTSESSTRSWPNAQSLRKCRSGTARSRAAPARAPRIGVYVRHRKCCDAVGVDASGIDPSSGCVQWR